MKQTLIFLLVLSFIFAPVYASSVLNKTEKYNVDLDNVNKLSSMKSWHEIYTKLENIPPTKILLILIGIFVLLWILAIPSRIAIESAGRLFGFDPDIGNFGSFILLLLYTFNFFIGTIAFILKFHKQVGIMRSILLAVVSSIIYIVLIFAFTVLSILFLSIIL